MKLFHDLINSSRRLESDQQNTTNATKQKISICANLNSVSRGKKKHLKLQQSSGQGDVEQVATAAAAAAAQLLLFLLFHTFDLKKKL